MYNNKHNSYIKIIINKYIMKKLLLSLFLLLGTLSYGQTVIEYDNMETSSTIYLGGGWWTPALTATWATNTSVSPTTSAVIYGSGNAASAAESDWYSMPNVVGLSATSQYQFKFKLASQSFTSPAAATRGMDVADIVDVQVSTNGGVSYVSELRITGNNSALWPYTATGSITHNANGVFTNSAAPTGDVYQSPAGVTLGVPITTGYSTVTLNLPMGITQVAVDIFCKINSAGEEWWIDNIQLIKVYSLPIELTEFTGTEYSEYNVLKWQTASEHNNSHYILERSSTGDYTEKDVINVVNGAGNSTQLLDYNFVDTDAPKTINYYRLTQVDYDGNFKQYGPISIDNRVTRNIIKYFNLMGQEVNEYETGLIILQYEDGTVEKVIR